MQVARAAAVKSEINVTPLVDVVLVLLIIFMVVTPMLQKGPAVKLPAALNPPRKPDDQKQLMVAIELNKVIWLEKEKMDEEQFATSIHEAFDRNPGSTIVVKGDARLTYGDIKRIVMKIKDAGFREVGLVVDRREAPAGGGA